MGAPSSNRQFLIALFLALLAGSSLADFSLRSLSVEANINKDGSVNVEERLEMAVNGQPSRELYEATRAAYSDLATWKNRTQLTEMRHHVSRANLNIENLRITPQALGGCNSFLGVCYATVILDYSVPAAQNGSGLVKVSRYKPRTALYSLVPDALSFEQTKTGDLVLPKGTTISITIPASSEKVYFSSPPQNVNSGAVNFRYDPQSNLRYYMGGEKTFSWGGDALSKFEFTFEVESPLETEVLDFFSELQHAVVRFLTGPEGLAALFILAAGGASAYYFNRLSAA